MKNLIFLGLLFSNMAYSIEITGEWSHCDVEKDGVIVYTTILTKNFRHEIILIGNGKSCNEIYKKAFAAIVSVSRMSINNNFVTYQKMKDSFVAFDDTRKDIIGVGQKCNLEKWLKTLDPRCEVSAEFSPDLGEVFLKEQNRISVKKYTISIKNNYLHEDLYPKDGLFPSRIYDFKLFK